MKQDFTALLERLTQSVKTLQHRYDSRKREFVTAKFDVALFSENFQPVDFYLKELDYSLEQLQRLTEQDVAQFVFFTEKLSAQCAALTDALERKNKQYFTQPYSSEYRHFAQQNAPKTPLTAREKRRQEVDRLPPRQRLVEYYKALHKLNEILQKQQDQHRICPEQQQAQYATLIAQTTQRRQRCLEAIELLEEYLTFKETQSSLNASTASNPHSQAV